MPQLRTKMTCCFGLVIFCLLGSAQELSSFFPENYFHISASNWQSIPDIQAQSLEAIEGICRVAVQHQNKEGAIIDPYVKREFQYSTPYIAASIGVLNHFGQAKDLLASGIKAMEHATRSFEQGSIGIPDSHGEFFIASLTHGLEIYKEFVPKETYMRWHKRLQTPLSVVMKDFDGRLNNWRAYAMNGEWARASHGLVDKAAARQFIEKSWKDWTQRERMASDKYNMYQDWSSDPQSFSVEAVGRGNLVSLLAGGYDGPSAPEIRKYVRNASLAALRLQSPTGQCPPNGRTDNHVFGDILYHVIFKAMAKDALAQHDLQLAGQYLRASRLSFTSIARWKRSDVPWAGSYSITKNHFDHSERVGFQPASQWGNYSGTMAWHLAEALLIDIPASVSQVPSPTEIGGYTLQSDPMFGGFVANAGGMQVFVNLRGAFVPKYGYSWTPMGAVRFSKAGWDDRLGPSDGESFLPVLPGQRAPENMTNQGKPGASFAPAWLQNGKWIHMADMPQNYQATPHVEFVHPLLVKYSLTYRYVTGLGGPYFKQEFTLTPDGVMVKSYCLQQRPFAVTAPLLSHDGRKLLIQAEDNIASTRYHEKGDEQHFINLNPKVQLSLGEDSIQSTYGWLRNARFEASAGDTILTFIYPRSPSQMSAMALFTSFQFEKGGFSSDLAKVSPHTYLSPRLAGGEGKQLDIDGDGKVDIQFDKSCKYLLKLEKGKIIAIELDRDAVVFLYGKTYGLEAYEPMWFPA